MRMTRNAISFFFYILILFSFVFHLDPNEAHELTIVHVGGDDAIKTRHQRACPGFERSRFRSVKNPIYSKSLLVLIMATNLGKRLSSSRKVEIRWNHYSF